jgi:rhamnosyltransferase
MNRDPIVSIVIRTLNESKTLGKVLQALQNQALQPNEIIIVDSGSTDNTIQVGERHGARIIELPSNSFSYGRALNIGFAASSGNILISLSGHAIPIDKDWLSNLARNFSTPKIAAVSSRLISNPDSRLHNLWFNMPFLFYRKPKKDILWLFWNTAAAYQREIWEQYRFNEDLHGCEDREWAMRILIDGYHIAYEPKSVVWHSHDEGFFKFAGRVLFIYKMIFMLHYQLKYPLKL